MSTLRDQLLGSWKLVSYVVEPNDGSPPRHPMGRAPKGLILYTSDGYMSAQIMRPGRPPFASGSTGQGTLEEYKSAVTGYLAYSGPFRTDDAAGTVIHSVDVSLFENWVDGDQVRKVELDGDTLVLSTVDSLAFGGRDYVGRLTWKRA